MPDFTTPIDSIEELNAFKNDTSIPLKVINFTD